MFEAKLIAYQQRVRVGRSKFSILLLGPGHPSRAKRAYREEIKAELRRSYRIAMMEDYTAKMDLDDKFAKIIVGKNLIAAIFVRNAGREGMTWELGFLEGFARGGDAKSGRSKGLDQLQRSVVAWVQKGVRNEITKMITEGIFNKIEVRDFDSQRDLISDMRTVCNRKLYWSYRTRLWP